MFGRKDTPPKVVAAAALPPPPPKPRSLDQIAIVARTKIMVVTSSLYPRLYMSIITANPDSEGAEMLVYGHSDIDPDNGLGLVEPGDKVQAQLIESNSKWVLRRATLSTTIEEEKARLRCANTASEASTGPLPPRHPLRTEK